ncbi:MAG: ribonuclease HII [Candidatus Omnitrophota bacterium]|nr:ribonuclease HII [Candidatus Omnitrophota bacterium]
MLYYENKAKKSGFNLIAGVDEVGRGPLAGPVVACAVILKKKRFKNRIDDSKKLSHKKRVKAFNEILEHSFVGMGIVSEVIIDSLNILEATQLAMHRAIVDLARKLKRQRKKQRVPFKKICVLIDGGFFSKAIPFDFINIIGGDSKSKSIASASIVAKVTRDRIMDIYDRIYPEYGFSRHKGYATQQHILAINKFGPSVIHRKTFHPIGCL